MAEDSDDCDQIKEKVKEEDSKFLRVDLLKYE
jgi:hypothetical protein